jgi:arylsulfatase A-like enzyme
MILAVLIPLRVVHTAGVRWMLVDGSLYTEVARHVRDGEGLVSNLSLYHAGYERFPYPTPLYPAWPLLLGTLAKVGDLATLAHWVPTVLYFTALAAAFVFGRRLLPGALAPSISPHFHAGHLLVLLLGLQRHFVYFTSLPYTEGLSWTLLLLFFGRLVRRSDDRSVGWAVELGAWIGALYFCRSQFLIVPMAVVLALGLRVVSGPERGRSLLHAVVTGTVMTGALGAWLLYLRTFLKDAGLQTLLRFDQNQASEVLTPLDILVDHGGWWETLLDRLEGVRLAWDPLEKASYTVGFGVSHWSLPFAIPFLLLASIGFLRSRGLRGLVDAVRRPEAFAWATLLLFAGGGLLSIHLAHKQFNGSWYFGQRQSLVCLPAFFLALAWMFRRGGVAAILATALVGATVAGGLQSTYKEAVTTGGQIRGEDAERELVAWLTRASADQPIVIAIAGSDAQRAAWRTRRVGYHGVYNTTSYADLLAMMDRLGARYFFYEEKNTRSWRFRVEGAGRLEHDFQVLPDHPDGHSILIRRATPPPPLPPKRVVVVGVDGASWKVMGPLIERGELPTFTRLMTEGASQLDFDTLDKTASPVVWTTVATGRMPDDHGVTDYTQEIPGQGKVPVTSDARKVPALWNVASDAGRTVSVINWWASWPAETVNGTIVSDHANPAAAGWMEGRYWNADPAALAALRKDTWPPEYADSLTTNWIDPAAFPLDDLDARGDFTEAQMAEVAAAPFNERTTYSWLKTFYAVDRPHWQIALEQLRTTPADLTMLYLRGPDPVQHYAWDTVEPFKYRELPGNLERDRGVVQGVYRYVDTFLADILASAGPDTTVVVLSDHGAEPSADAKKKKMERPGGHTRAAKGVLFLWGPDVRPGAKISKAGPLDIAPTVAWALGLPVAEDLPGRVLAEAFTYDFRARRGRSDTPTWGTRSANTGASASPADDSMMEQLRGLGYIE